MHLSVQILRYIVRVLCKCSYISSNLPRYLLQIVVISPAELSSKKPYTVTRSSNHMLPVYLRIKERKRREQTHGKRMLTVVGKVGGDIKVSCNFIYTRPAHMFSVDKN